MARGLELRLWWGDHLAAEHFFRGGVSTAFWLDVTAQDPPLVSCLRGGKPAVTIPPCAVGVLERDGESRELRAAKRLFLKPGDRLTIALGHLTAELREERAPRAVSVPLSHTTDFKFANVLAASLGALAVFIISAALHEPHANALSDWSSAPPTRIVTLIHPAPPRAQGSAIDRSHRAAVNRSARAAPAAPRSQPSARPATAPHLSQLLGAQSIAALINPGIGPSAELMLGIGALQAANGFSPGSAGGRGALTGVPGDTERGPIGIGGIHINGAHHGSESIGQLRPDKHKIDPVIDGDFAEPPRGALDPELIRAVIHRNHGQIRFCYESQLIRSPRLGGKVSVHFTISGEGTVASSMVNFSNTGNEELNHCIATKVRLWVFPKPKGDGVVSVTYPFVLRQSGQ